MDLIDRQDAIDVIRATVAEGILADTLELRLNELPSAQKTGKWIHDGKDFPHGNDWIHCSVCGKRGINVPADLTNYCPSCGSRMKEGGTE